MGLFNIEANVENAKQLIGSQSPRSLNFACLELRFCLEKIAYRQLKQYGDDLPSKVLSAWQPDKIMRLLMSVDPLLALDLEGPCKVDIVVGQEDFPQDDEWKHLGERSLIPWKRFRTYYQKLGSYLHAHKGEEIRAPEKEFLQSVIEDLEKVANGDLVLASKLLNTAKCPCGGLVVRGIASNDAQRLFSCSNNQCKLLYRNVQRDDGGWVLECVGDLAVACGCGSKIHVEPDLMASIKCSGCGRAPAIKIAPPS